MIIVASQRGGAIKHGKHLLKSENEHVTVHEVSGFMADDVLGACKEDQAIARGTKCKQHIFTASFNAPEDEEVTTKDYISNGRKALLTAPLGLIVRNRHSPILNSFIPLIPQID